MIIYPTHQIKFHNTHNDKSILCKKPENQKGIITEIFYQQKIYINRKYNMVTNVFHVQYYNQIQELR